ACCLERFAGDNCVSSGFETHMTPDFAIAAPILARNPQESKILLASVERLAAHGPVFLADGGSIEGFTDRLSEFSDVQVQVTPGSGPRLLAQVRLALASASESGCSYILYTEPDKQWFFENRLSAFLKFYSSQKTDVGIYVPARNPISFRTFPAGQQTPERLFNTLAAETLGAVQDYLYGPLLIRRDLIPYLEPIPADIGWGWRIFLLTIACRLGMPLVPWEADLPCPIEQRGEDDARSRTYRLEQMAQNVRGLALGRRYLLPSE
ncbi:MAG: hypothetical protein V4671_16100, partial [Armatimonadota bacterium]